MTKRIPVVLFVLPSLRMGGAERQVVELLRRLDRTSFLPLLATFDGGGPLTSELVEDVAHFSLERRSFVDGRLLRELSRIIDEMKVDVVHTTLQIALWCAFLAISRSKRKPPLVNALHRTVPRNLKERAVERCFYGPAMRRVRRSVFVCRDQERYWVQQFGFLEGSTSVVYNGVDTEEFKFDRWRDEGSKLRSDLGIPDDGTIVSCVAGLRVEKNHLGLLNAFAGLPRTALEKTWLLLAGDGARRPEIESRVSTLGLGGRAILLGNVSEVRPLLAASAFTTLQSYAIETFSIAMLESMAMERPMVSTDVGGHREAIEHGKNGLLVPIGNTEALGYAMKDLIERRELCSKLGSAARRCVVERFSVGRMMDGIEGVLRDVA